MYTYTNTMPGPDCGSLIIVAVKFSVSAWRTRSWILLAGGKRLVRLAALAGLALSSFGSKSKSRKDLGHSTGVVQT